MKTKLLIISVMLMVSCGRKNTPQVQYIETKTTHYDTVDNVVYVSMDTIFSSVPCDSFTRIIRQKDTVYIREVKKVVETKTVVKRDTFFLTPIITKNVKINNKGGQIGTGNISGKSKKGDNVIGDGNTITKPVKKGSSWFWIFVCGYMTCVLVSKVLMPTLRKYIPVFNMIPTWLV